MKWGSEHSCLYFQNVKHFLYIYKTLLLVVCSVLSATCWFFFVTTGCLKTLLLYKVWNFHTRIHMLIFTYWLHSKVPLFQAKLLFLSLSSKLSCWSNRGSISWGTIRHPWKRPVCLWPSQAIGPCPEHSRPRPLRPFPLWCRNHRSNRALPPVSHSIRWSILFTN